MAPPVFSSGSYSYRWKPDDSVWVREWTGRSSDDAILFGFNQFTLEPAIPLWCLNQVRSRIDAAIRDADFDAGVFMGELRHTLIGISDLLRDLMDILDVLHNPAKFERFYFLSLRAVREIGSRASQEYLRYMYGIRPIMQDIYGATEDLNKKAPSGEMKRAKARVIDSDFTPDSWPSKVADYKWLEGRCERGVEAAVSFSCADTGLFKLSRHGLLSPMSLAWELVTLSFVVDWFTGFGNFLKTLEAPIGVITMNHYETSFCEVNVVRNENVWKYNDEPYGSNAVFQGGSKIGKTGIVTKGFRRSSNPWSHIAPPYIRLDPSTAQAVSAVALLVAAVTRGPNRPDWTSTLTK